jgi:hypothetical protein
VDVNNATAARLRYLVGQCTSLTEQEDDEKV